MASQEILIIVQIVECKTVVLFDELMYASSYVISYTLHAVLVPCALPQGG